MFVNKPGRIFCSLPADLAVIEKLNIKEKKNLNYCSLINAASRRRDRRSIKKKFSFLITRSISPTARTATVNFNLRCFSAPATMVIPSRLCSCMPASNGPEEPMNKLEHFHRALVVTYAPALFAFHCTISCVMPK